MARRSKNPHILDSVQKTAIAGQILQICVRHIGIMSLWRCMPPQRFEAVASYGMPGSWRSMSRRAKKEVGAFGTLWYCKECVISVQIVFNSSRLC